MTGSDFLNSLGNWVLWSATAMLTIVIAYYHLTARWWKTPEGRHIMAWTFVMWTVLMLATASTIGALSLEVRLWIRLVVFALFLWLGIWRFLLIARAQSLPGVPEDSHRHVISDQ